MKSINPFLIILNPQLIDNQTSAALILPNVPSASLPKIAILMFYLRLNPTKGFHWNTIAVLLITWAYLISFMFAQIFGCSPPDKF